MPTQTYQRVMAALASEGPEQWDAIAAELPGFPDGLDDVVHRRWIVNALGTGSAASVRWMLKKASISTFVTAKATRRFTPSSSARRRIDTSCSNCCSAPARR